MTPTFKSLSPSGRLATAFLLLIVLLFAAGDGSPGPWLAGGQGFSGSAGEQALALRTALTPNQHVTADVENASLPQIIAMYGELTGRTPVPSQWKEALNDASGGYFVKLGLISLPRSVSTLSFHNDGRWRVDELKETLENVIRTNGLVAVADGDKHFRVVRAAPGSK